MNALVLIIIGIIFCIAYRTYGTYLNLGALTRQNQHRLHNGRRR